MKRDHLIRKDVQYVNKDFGQLRRDLINFTKTYFPDTYNDFNESSPGMMFMELAAYVGDVLSFYTDIQLRESFLATAQEKINLYNIGKSYGYNARITTPAVVDLDVFQLLPPTGTGENTLPDYRYALSIEPNMIVTNEDGIIFRTVEPLDFRYSSSFSPTSLTVYSLDELGEIEYYLLKKTVKAVSGTIITRTYSFDAPKPYDKITLPETDVLEIIDIYDADGNRWYETQFLAQDLVPRSIPNMPYNDSVLSRDRATVPYLLTYLQTEYRFVTRLRSDDRTEIQFGAGVSSHNDNEFIPNLFDLGRPHLSVNRESLIWGVDPKNFLYTKTYGKSPSNTVLTVRYSIGGGVRDNVSNNSLNVIESRSVVPLVDQVDAVVYNTILESLAVNNPEPARGGLTEKDFSSLRQDMIAYFAAQNRAVTKEDYIVRCYSMPVRFGAVAKAYVERDTQLTSTSQTSATLNPLALNLYTLGYDSNNNFTALNEAVKFNLRNYLGQYRLLTDSINIKDAYIINIGIYFEIVVDGNFNATDVLLKCIHNLQEEFQNSKMEIGRPIFVNNVLCMINDVEGVISTLNVNIYSNYKTSEGYSGNFYDIKSATQNGILYPSLDPSIFEIKYPKRDIQGRVVDYS